MSSNVISVPYMSIEEYLANEEPRTGRREYVGGMVYAMAESDVTQCTITGNLAGMLWLRLRGKPHEPFGVSMPVLLRLSSTGFTCIYYPDAMVACDPTDRGHGWRERPAVLFEVVSEETRQIDQREKRAAYLQLGSLEAYVRIEQDRPEVVVERRTWEGWMTERLVGLDAVIRLPAIDIHLPLAELYERIPFYPSDSHKTAA